jgi:uncharacterized YccA/Bax inhibitor family protein
LSNPVFNRTKERLSKAGFGSPALAPSAAMTVDDVVVKTIICMTVLVATAVVGWTMPALASVGAIVAFVIGLFAIFKRNTSRVLVLAYAAAEGLAVGGLSVIFEDRYPGIVIQAVIGTVSVLAVTLVLFLRAGVRATPKMMKFLLAAMIGYLVYSLINFALVATGVLHTPFGVDSMMIPHTSIPIGVVVGLLVVLMAAFNFIVDFTVIEEEAAAGVPAVEAWRNAFGLMLTIVWLYLEILRLLALLRGQD